MSLKSWQSNGWLRTHQTSFQEVENLLTIVERDLVDATTQKLSVDWRFGIAYNAVLKLCTIMLYASGYKPEKTNAHYRTLASLSLILGNKYEKDAEFLNVCRIKRNETEYDFAGSITENQATELMNFAHKLKPLVLEFLKTKHPTLVTWSKATTTVAPIKPKPVVKAVQQHKKQHPPHKHVKHQPKAIQKAQPPAKSHGKAKIVGKIKLPPTKR